MTTARRPGAQPYIMVAAALALAGCGPQTARGPTPVTRPTAATARLPAFALGWYSQERAANQNLAVLAHGGVTLMIAYHAGEPFTTRWLRATRRAGIRVLLQPPAGWVQAGNVARLRAFVRRYRGFSNIVGWYLYDEPDFTSLPPAKLQAARRAIAGVDRRPVAVVFTTGNCLFGPQAINPAYLEGFDLLLFDRYPFYRNMPDFNPVTDIARVVRNCAHSAHLYHKQGPIMVLQGFGGVQDGPYRWRDPTYGETMRSVDEVRAAGARGALFYSEQAADRRVWSDVLRIMRQVAALSGSAAPRGASP